MSAADEIARLRALKRDAPPLPYRYREGAEGDPSNGPTFTALEAEHPDLIWSEIARGDYDAWSGYGLMYAAEACTALPKALDALEAVLALHQPVKIYAQTDECGCGDEDHTIIESPQGDDLCWDTPTGELCCPECLDEDSGAIDYPCPTVAEIAEALGVEP